MNVNAHNDSHSARFNQEKGLGEMNVANIFKNTMIVTFLAVSGWQSKIQAQGTPPVAPASASSALSASTGTKAWSGQSLWQGFLELAAKPNANITLGDLKKAFPKEKISQTLPGTYKISDVLSYSVSVPPRLHQLYPGRKMIYIAIYFKEADSATCPDKEKLVDDLEKVGWHLYSDLPARIEGGVDGIQLHLPSEANFNKGGQGLLDLTYINGCPSQIFLQADKVRFEQIPAVRTAKENAQ
ncbi:hypothetical protein [Dyella choica]|uniref:Uncharacterized protein n=1 Tax=Dyella choica TaxID=1927959 RepID=A0A3S0Q3T6_9GAMM|nr:hypothetical protein [Dyella choica]RUL73702.1 hypothetical protein EKH80_15430 [Dyella choica]